MDTSVYPVRVEAALESPLSRWLWLVKWLLAIPHYVVLAFLWPAFVVLSVVAFVAILLTGRYPRTLFDFNVGVLRWTWRVAYYAYGGLGTDHYPPFSLDERPDYPAHLTVAYPEHLSRGLVLVKWWLLAIPHYLVVTLFVGSGWYVVDDDRWVRMGSGGLIALLVLVAAVVLLFTGRYPQPVFDLVLGLNRWVLRVAAYASLMTDAYPPFRLDLGGTEPDGSLLVASSSTPPAAAAPPPPGRRPAPGAGRVVAVVLGALASLAAFSLLVGGGALRVAEATMRDDAGYLTSATVPVDSPGYAVSTRRIELHDGAGAALPERLLGTVRVRATARTANGVFVGIAPTAAAERYLDGVASSELVDPDGPDGEPELTFYDGGSPHAAPTDVDFWVASAVGREQATVTWAPESGDWTLVVMNGEGTTPVRADVSVGATVPLLDDVGNGLLVAGAVLGVAGATTLVLALRRRSSLPVAGGAG